MSTFTNDRGRPATNGTPSKMSIATDIPMIRPADRKIRCARCGHVVWARESIRRELGPVCRRIAADIAEVAA